MRADMIVAMLEGRDPGPTTFSIANAVKDLRTMVGDRRSARRRHAATKAALAGFEDATKHGIGGGDGAQMTVYWSSRQEEIREFIMSVTLAQASPPSSMPRSRKRANSN